MKLSDLPIHHAVLVVTDKREGDSLTLWNELTALSPAHRFFNQTVLDIETARSIISWANTPYNEEKVALISFHTSGVPAQNAMLKILEDPREGVKFILVTSNKDSLLPTVLSRLQEASSSKNEERRTKNDRAQEFFQTKPTMRMKLTLITDLLSRVDEEERKDREAVRGFILELLAFLSKQKNVKPKFMEELLNMASYASDPSASGKAIMEYISLLLPQLEN